MSIPPFPTDPSTLDLLWIALNPAENEAERTSVSDYLDFMSRMAGSDPDAVESIERHGGLDNLAEDLIADDPGAYEIHIMRDPIYHEHDVIRSLITEVRNLRAELDDAYAQMLHRPHLHSGKTLCRLDRKPWPCPDASDADAAAYEELHALRQERDDLRDGILHNLSREEEERTQAVENFRDALAADFRELRDSYGPGALHDFWDTAANLVLMTPVDDEEE